jgi:hypothetical protein
MFLIDIPRLNPRLLLAAAVFYAAGVGQSNAALTVSEELLDVDVCPNVDPHPFLILFPADFAPFLIMFPRSVKKLRLLATAAVFSAAFAVGVGQPNADIVALTEPGELLDVGDVVDEGTTDATATEEGVTRPSAERLERLERRLQYGWAEDAVLAVSVRRKGMRCR